MFKKVLVFIALMALLGAAFASAANLNVNGGTLQAGSYGDLTCDADGVEVAYTTNYVDGVWKVTDVVISGIDDTCSGTTIAVVLILDGESAVGPVSGTINDESITISLGTAAPNADAVAGIDILVKN